MASPERTQLDTAVQTTMPTQQAHLEPQRRKLFRGAAAGGVGVLMAVQSKTALGTLVCASPSVMMSGNHQSHTPVNAPACGGGRSPGFWKQPQHKNSWAFAGAVWPTFKVLVDCATGVKLLSVGDIKAGFPGTTLAAAGFAGGGIPATLSGNAPGLWAVLAYPHLFPSSPINGQLLRHLAAAWLNAGYPWPGGEYPVTRAEIIKMWDATKNNIGLYCPTSTPGCAGWNAQAVVDYIAGIFDDNAALYPDDLKCKK